MFYGRGSSLLIEIIASAMVSVGVAMIVAAFAGAAGRSMMALLGVR